MASSRRLLLGLCLGWQAACGAPATRDANPGKSEPPAASEPAEEAEPDLRALLRLDERSFPLTVWAAYIIQSEYFDKQRLDPRGQLVSALRYLGLHTPEFFAALVGDQAIVTVGGTRKEFALTGMADLQAAGDRLEQILGFTQAELGLAAEATHKLEYAAINGLLAPLDPHTILLTPEEHTDLGVKTRGQFGGIGAEIREDERRIRVIKVLPGSPAEKGGLRPGDLLLQIDKQSTVNLRAADAQQMLRGPVDTEVIVKVRRGEQTLTLTLKRQIIRFESVTAELLPGQIAYLRLLTFQENTGEQVRVALKNLAPKTGEGLRGVVLDLRDNTGGLLTQAVEVLDGLVASGELVIVRSAMGREFEAAKPDLELPLSSSVVALINEESASASEIVSGSVKYLERGVVLGRPSFGKGTVQLVKPENFYGSELALKITIAEYLVAGDRSIQTAGVQPDLALFPVDLTNIPGVANYYDRERFDRRREYAQVAHLPSAKHEKPRVDQAAAPGLQLRYLADGGGGGKVAAASEGPEALRDPEVRIAHQVAQSLAGATDGATRQARLAAVARDLALAENTAIAAAVGATKIDWQGKVDAHEAATLGLVARIAQPGEIRAGAPFTLHVEVTNNGATPVDRVHAITDCLRDELDGIELLVGRLGPGQTVSRDLRLQVMAWHSSFTDTIRVDLHAGEPDLAPDASTTVRFDVAGLTRPHLTYDYWIVDDPALAAKAPPRPPAVTSPGEAPFAVRGNGDGNLQAGEQVLLAIEVGNIGPGPASDTRALIHNLSGGQVLLEEGFVQLGPVKAGGTVRGSFGLTVSPNADPAAPVSFDVVVADVQLHESVRHKFKLDIVPAGAGFHAAAEKQRVGSEQIRLYNAADGKASVVGELPPGAQVELLGRVGGWGAVSAGSGRRFWLPGDLLQPGDGKGTTEQPTRMAALVQPPVLALEPAAQVTDAAEIEIRGTARHPLRVHDVLVTVKPPGVSQVEQKIDYEANPARQGDGARQMSFSAQVPLAPGSNQILVTARDAEDVEATRELWVFRRADGNLGPAD